MQDGRLFGKRQVRIKRKDLLQDWSIGCASILEIQNPFDGGKVTITDCLYPYFEACIGICEGEGVCGTFFIKRFSAIHGLPTLDEIFGGMPVVDK